jgi:hypothetical protein
MEQSAGVPRARCDGLVIQQLPEEVLIYDRERDKAHCLNQTAALVWKYCDGKTTVANMARKLARDLDSTAIDEKVVWYALDQLSKDHLLEESLVPPAMLAGMTRREMVRALGVAAIVAVPLVTSIVAPTPAQASTCFSTGAPCISSAQCCSGLCSSSACT